MAKTTSANTTTVQPAFDIDAYLASPANKSSGGITSWVASRVEDSGKAGARFGAAIASSLEGVGEIYELNRKAGAIRAARRIEDERARVRAEIQRLLAR